MVQIRKLQMYMNTKFALMKILRDKNAFQWDACRLQITVRGVSVTETPPDRDPPQTETPPGQRPSDRLPNRDPLVQRPPWTETKIPRVNRMTDRQV